jgi:hypothetical protein
MRDVLPTKYRTKSIWLEGEYFVTQLTCSLLVKHDNGTHQSFLGKTPCNLPVAFWTTKIKLYEFIDGFSYSIPNGNQTRQWKTLPFSSMIFHSY